MKGKIVCYSVEWKGYDETVVYRSIGAIVAAKYGAIGALVRSITPYSIESPHVKNLSLLNFNKLHFLKFILIINN